MKRLHKDDGIESVLSSSSLALAISRRASLRRIGRSLASPLASLALAVAKLGGGSPVDLYEKDG